MKSNRLLIWLLFACLPLFSIILLPYKVYAVEFSATQSERLANPNIKKIIKDSESPNESEQELLIKAYEQPKISKIYVKGKNFRQEQYTIVVSGDGKVGKSKEPFWVEIICYQKNTEWVLWTKEKAYTETHTISKHNIEANFLRKLKRSGQETIEGYKCDKYSGNIMCGSEDCKVDIWWSTKLNYVLKSITRSSAGAAIIELSNINEGKLPDKLFQLPKSYKKK